MNDGFPTVWVIALLIVALAVTVVATFVAALQHDWGTATIGVLSAVIAAACIRHEMGEL